MTETLTPQTQAMLDSLVPSPTLAADYVNREFSGYFDFDVYRAAMAAGHNVLLSGPTGTGKTMSARAFAAAEGLPFYTVALNQAIDFSMLMGWHTSDGAGGIDWYDGILTSMVRAKMGVVLMDEMNMAQERNMARLYGLFDSRRELVVYEHQGEVLRVGGDSRFLIIGAYNPGYRGTRELSEALPNRFAFKLRFDYDEGIEAQLVALPSVRELAGKLRSLEREIRTPVSTNMLVEMCEIAVAFSADFAIANWLQAFAEHERASVAQVTHLYRTRLSQEAAELNAEMETE